METVHKVAIYMDHFTADVIEYFTIAKLIKTIKSEFNLSEKKNIIQKGESHLHHKEQDLQQKFYQAIKDELKQFDSILLFGTTNAKTELLHILQADTAFVSKEITLKNTEKLTDKEKNKFVNDFFYIQ